MSWYSKDYLKSLFIFFFYKLCHQGRVSYSNENGLKVICGEWSLFCSQMIIMLWERVLMRSNQHQYLMKILYKQHLNEHKHILYLVLRLIYASFCWWSVFWWGLLLVYYYKWEQNWYCYELKEKKTLMFCWVFVSLKFLYSLTLVLLFWLMWFESILVLVFILFK